MLFDSKCHSFSVRLAEFGVVHGDFNEFNIMIDDHEKITVIDFPQVITVDHANAQMYETIPSQSNHLFIPRLFESTVVQCLDVFISSNFDNISNLLRVFHFFESTVDSQ